MKSVKGRSNIFQGIRETGLINKGKQTEKVQHPNLFPGKICAAWEIEACNVSRERTENIRYSSRIEEAFQKFCSETSLHGLKYVADQRRHISQRVFWTIAFMMGVLTAGYLITEIFQQFGNSPLIVTLKATQASIDQVPFPAVTICNVNSARKSIVENLIEQLSDSLLARVFLYYLHHLCLTSGQSFANKFNYSSERTSIPDIWTNTTSEEATEVDEFNHQTTARGFLLSTAQPCSEMILLCRWENENKNCNELFRATITDYGVCCTFNLAPEYILQNSYDNDSLENEFTTKWNESDLSIEGLLLEDETEVEALVYPKRVKRSGLSYGLSILLNPEIDEYFCTSSDSSGFQLVTHLPIETANVAEYGKAIGSDLEIFIKVTSDITIADPGINFLEPDIRKCYLPGEYTLKYYVNYTSGNCFDECLANITYKNCECIRYYMTKDDMRRICGPHQYICAEKIKKHFVKHGKKGNCPQCYSTCTDISYLTEVTTRPMRHDQNIWQHLENNTIATWANKSVSLIHIYFGEDTMYPKMRKRLYSVTDLIASTGGLLGLCLGFSVLSGIELIYFLVINLVGKNLAKYWKSKRLSTTVSLFDDKATRKVF